MPNVRRVDTAWARQIVAVLDARGKPADLILKEVGLDPVTVQEPESRIPFYKHVALLNVAGERLADPSFGLHFGSSLDPLEAGAIGYVGASSAKLGEAIQNLVTYVRVFTEGARPKLEVKGQLATFSVDMIDPRVTDRQQIHEFGLALVMNFARFATGRRLTPELVEFRHSQSTNQVELKKYFGAPVNFGRPHNAIVLKRSHLELSCAAADARLLRILKKYCEDILEELPEKNDLKHDVEHLIATLLPSGGATNQRIARELGMSERTLARRLTDLGTSYGQILEEVRQQLAFLYRESVCSRLRFSCRDGFESIIAQ